MEKKIIIVFCLISVVLLGACSSEETITSDGNQVNAAKGLSFQFSEEAYVPGVIKNGTRLHDLNHFVHVVDGLC